MSLAGCLLRPRPVAAPPPPPAPPPSCDSTPDTSIPAERGIRPFESQAELAAAKGKTVYLAASGPLQAYDGGILQGEHGLFGEPLVLCDVTIGPNRHISRSDEVAGAQNALAKTPTGRFVEVNLASLSSRLPLVSLATPGDARDMLLGAFREAYDADRRLRELGLVGHAGDLDRTLPEFWRKIAHDQAERVRKDAAAVVRALVRGMGEFKQTLRRDGRGKEYAVGEISGAALAPKGPDGTQWVMRASPTVQHLVQFGIPKGPERTSYDHLVRCTELMPNAGTRCDAAITLVADPPAIPERGTAGGTINLHIARRRGAQIVIEVDGQPVEVAGDNVAVPVTSDGFHVVRGTGAGMREFEEKVRVQFGESVKLNVIMIPK
ncbi:MAG TPA: hypothetical protein VK601_15150 [Kofleriaceae bacterium]|nr:hypothetical protein [Kofleriaceae bacterium]